MNKIISSLYKSITLRALIITLALCFFYTGFLAETHVVRVTNLKIIDSFFRLNHALRPKDNVLKDVVLISIDDESLRKMNAKWPWPRVLTAEMLERLARYKPRVVCVDLLFVGKSRNAEEDIALADVLNNNKNILIPAYFGDDGRYVVPEETIARNAKAFGFVNKPRDIDNVARRMLPTIATERGDIIDYSLAVKTAGEFLGRRVEDIVSSVPATGDGIPYIYFFGDENTFKIIPVWKILKGDVAANSIKDKIVFYGMTSGLLHDAHPTPLGIMPGVILTLNETLTYITGNFFDYKDKSFNFAAIFLFVFIAVIAGLRLPVVPGIILSIVEIMIFFALSSFLFLQNTITDFFGVILLVFMTALFLYGLKYIKVVLENIILKREAITDGLTGLYVYKYFELNLKNEFRKALKEKKNLALVIYDIDHFKKINDTYGHEFGNTVLRIFSKILQNNTRQRNVIARYGGEEFCVLIPGAKMEDVVKYAERIRNRFKETRFLAHAKEAVKITLSAGIATEKDITSRNHMDLIKAADSALYTSKNSGRDRVTVFQVKI